MTVRVRPVIALFGKVYLRRWVQAAIAATAAYLALAGAVLAVVANPAIPERDVIRGLIGFNVVTIWFIVLAAIADRPRNSYLATDLPCSPAVGRLVISAMRGRVPGIDVQRVRDLMSTWVALDQAYPQVWSNGYDYDESQAYASGAADRVWAQIEALLADPIAAIKTGYDLPDDAQAKARDARAFRTSVDQAVQAATPPPLDQP